MAAENHSNMNGTTGFSPEETTHHEYSRPLMTKRLALALITFLPAFILLSIINFAVTKLFVSKAPAATPIINDAPKTEPKIVTKTVYIDPSDADLESLRREIETSDPLPPFVPNDERSGRIKSILSSLKTAVDARENEQNTASKEYADLKTAYDSFLQRFDDDIAKVLSASEEDRLKSALLLNKILSSLESLSALNGFSSIDRKSLTNKFESASNSLILLMQSDEILFHNNEGILLEALINGTSFNSESCSLSSLNITGDKVCEELLIPEGVTMKERKASEEVHIPDGTARESDLYKSVESIKEILTRRDITLMKPGADGSIPSPLDESGTDSIRKKVSDAAITIGSQRATHASQQKEIRLQWMAKVDTSMPDSSLNAGDDSMCANQNLVEQMVAGGLESLRKKSDLSRELRTSLFSALIDEPNFEAHDMTALQQAMVNVKGVQIDYEKKKELPSFSTESRRKSVRYLVDSPLLHRGVTAWINNIIDFISGYNDYVDALIDWIVGDSQSTAGEIFAETFLRVVSFIPYHDEFAERFKSVGILGGRTRALLEES